MEQDFRHLIYIGFCCILAASLLSSLLYVLDSNKEIASVLHDEDRLQELVTEYQRYPYKFENTDCNAFDVVEYAFLNKGKTPVTINGTVTDDTVSDEDYLVALYRVLDLKKTYSVKVVEDASGIVTSIVYREV